MSGIVHRPGEGQHIWGMSACISVKLPADAAEDRRASAIEILAPPEFGPPLHIHHEEDELLQVLEGTVRVVCGDNIDAILETGGFAFLPRGVSHAFWVLDGPARLLLVFTPGGAEAMFVDSGQPADGARLPEAGAVAPGAMEPFEARHHVETVGPPLGASDLPPTPRPRT